MCIVKFQVTSGENPVSCALPPKVASGGNFCRLGIGDRNRQPVQFGGFLQWYFIIGDVAQW